MERSMVLFGLVVLCVLLSAVPAARAEWVQDGVLVVTSSIDEEIRPGIQFGMVSDGRGGAIVFWAECRGGTGKDIFAQRIDARGDLRWTEGGIAVCAAPGDQTVPRPVTDDSGGVIFLWSDRRGGDFDIYAQRLDADGNPLWAVDGIAVRTAAGEQVLAGTISNGTGGAIVLWFDYTADDDECTIDALLIDPDADELWTVEDVVPGVSASYQQIPGITSDGAGGAIITWKDFEGRTGSMADVRIQRIDSAGRRRWGDAGRVIVDDTYFVSNVMVRSDGAGGAMLVWEDRGNDPAISRIFAQHVLSDGTPHWTDGGVPVCAREDVQLQPRLVSDCSGGIIVFWEARLTGEHDIFAQRVDGNGDLLWSANGIPICDTPDDQQTLTAVSDESGGAIVAWADFPPVHSRVADIYAQHVTGEGVSLWPPAGLPVCRAPGQQAYTLCLTDGAGGAVIAWADTRSGTQAGYVQRIDRYGNWGYPAPSVEAVRDVPGDQGGFVNLAWTASRLDVWPGHDVSCYSVWRAIDPEQAALALKSGGAIVSDLAGFASGPERPLIRVELASNGTRYWNLVSTVHASHLDGYSEIVPTLFDSTDVCDEYHYFQVIAHGDDPGMYWISAPDSGRSVDNLAPAPPAGLTGLQRSDATGLRLTWNRGGEADLAHYAVYRGSTDGFEPCPGNRMAAHADTLYLDGEWRPGSRNYYKVTAVDVHGNESRCSLLRPEDVEGGNSHEIPAATFLAQNYPNPFNPSTRIIFGLGEPGFVSMRIYDAAGRLVRVLVEKHFEAGTHEALWNGCDERGSAMSSGVYFCRLEAGTYTGLRKLIILK